MQSMLVCLVLKFIGSFIVTSAVAAIPIKDRLHNPTRFSISDGGGFGQSRLEIESVSSQRSHTSGRVELTPTGDAHGVSRHQNTGSPARKPFRQLTNGSTPTGWIQIGTPSKWLLAIFDTGSDKLVAKTWETIASELATIDQGVSGMVAPSGLIYSHNASSSYRHQFIKDPKTGKEVPQRSSITYGSGTAITDVGTDTIFVGDRHLDNFTLMEITADSLHMLHTKKGIAGVLGLQHMKNKSLGNSLFSRLRDADLLTSFGYCRGSGNNGTFIWGDDAKEGQELEVIGEMHWAVKLVDVKVGSKTSASSLVEEGSRHSKASTHDDEGIWPFTSSKPDSTTATELINACGNASCTAILDTGSNIMAGPRDAITKIAKFVNVKPDCSNFEDLPPITMNFGGMPVSIPGRGYVMKIPKPDISPIGAARSRSGAGLAETQTNQPWEELFQGLHKNYGIEVNEMQRQHGQKNPEFICMPALVPLDMHTKYGPLWVVGTPLLDAYYARWSWAKGDASPKIHLKALEDAKVCKDDGSAVGGDSAPAVPTKDTSHTTVMRSQSNVQEASPHHSKRGPIERRPEEISYPHWAKDLLHL